MSGCHRLGLISCESPEVDSSVKRRTVWSGRRIGRNSYLRRSFEEVFLVVESKTTSRRLVGNGSVPYAIGAAHAWPGLFLAEGSSSPEGGQEDPKHIKALWYRL